MEILLYNTENKLAEYRKNVDKYYSRGVWGSRYVDIDENTTLVFLDESLYDEFVINTGRRLLIKCTTKREQRDFIVSSVEVQEDITWVIE